MVQHLRPAADSLEDALRGLGAIASTRRRGEELVTLAVGAHGAALERLVGLSPDPQLLEQDGELAELLWVNRPAPPEAEVLNGFAERVDRALAAIENVGVPGLSELALGLLDTVNELYGAGFARAFELLHGAGHHDAIRAALDDDLVASELVISGMHPDDVETRARRALERIGATFAPGGPSVGFSGIDEDGTVRLRVTGLPVRDRWRVALAAERAVAAVTPDAPTVSVDGVDGDDDAPPATDVFIPLGSIGRRARPAPSRWIEVPELAALEPGALLQLAHGELRLLACRVGPDLYVALDPFSGDGLRLSLPADRPPTVQSPTGVVFTFDAPLPVHRDGDLIEVAVP